MTSYFGRKSSILSPKRKSERAFFVQYSNFRVHLPAKKGEKKVNASGHTWHPRATRSLLFVSVHSRDARERPKIISVLAPIVLNVPIHG